MRIALLLALIVLVQSAFAREMTPAERMSDFDQLTGILGGSYGMIGYKKEKLGLDFNTLVASYKAKVAQAASDQSFYELLQAFIAEFHDAHLGLSRPSTMLSKLGFGTRRFHGKAIITAIDRKALPETTFPFAVGDELASIDGKPVATQIREWAPYESNAREDSALGALTRQLAFRGGWAVNVPTGTARVEIKRFGADKTETVVLPWIVSGQALPGLSFLKGGGPAVGPVAKLREIDGKGVAPGIVLAANAAALPSEQAAMPSWAPGDPQVIASEIFPAAMFDSPKGPLGYVKISSFSPPNRDQEAAVKDFRRILKEMRFTRGLIIDLNDNPGGSVTYVNQLAATLMDHNLDIVMWSERASRKTLVRARSSVDDETDPGASSLLANEAKGIEKAMEAGLDMTPFGYTWGFTTQAPDPEITYSKPVLVLINDQCYSGGDMFPSLLQDNGRVKLFGMNTAGAGGSVRDYGQLSYSGCSIRVTETIWQRRPSGAFIENEGAHPDIPYEIDQEDVAHGYRAYRAAYTKALEALIQ